MRRTEHREHLERAFGRGVEDVDLVLLAGDLTTHGLVEEAHPRARRASAHRRRLPRCSETTTTTAGSQDEIRQPGCSSARVSSSSTSGHVVLELAGMEDAGVVGAKGFVGGFPGAEIADFGERLLREVYARDEP